MTETLSRRDVIAGGMTVAFVAPTFGGKAFAAAATAPAKPPAGPAPGRPLPKPINPSAFIEIPPTGPVRLIMPYVEMGQGSYTGQAMMLAEELDVGLDQVEVVHAMANPELYGRQSTGGSVTTRTAWKSMREAAAVARDKLVRAAASQWGVAPAELTTDHGAVIHKASNRSATYGSLASAAMRLPNPEAPTLKEASQFKLIGKDYRRLDTAEKVNGKAIYGMDVMLPGLKVAAVRSAPTLGGEVKALDDAAARAMPGVRDVLIIPNAVAVIADHYWAANKALDALKITWTPGTADDFDTHKWFETQAEAYKTTPPIDAVNEGDLAVEGKKVEAAYHVQKLAHATMEPTNAVVWVRGGKCDVWMGNQNPVRMRDAAAKVCGLPVESVIVHNQYLGGGFGRRVFTEGVERACHIAKQVNYPVKVIFSREEDIKTDIFRPQVHHAMTATLGEDGMPLVWTHRVTCGSVSNRYGSFGPLQPGKIDGGSVEGAREPIYKFPGVRVDWVRCEPPDAVTMGFWRGVGSTINLFPVEGFIDELAHAAGKDPLEYRRALISEEHPRALGVLNAAAEKFGWTKSSPKPGVGCGIAVAHAFGSYICGILEVEVSPQGLVKLNRCVVAVDCGYMVNPNSVIAQVEGGIIFGWTAALHGEIAVKNGAIQQTNFNNYRMMRLDETPVIETVLIKSTENPGGMGEASTVLAAPGLMNAIFAATGVRVRELPLKPEDLVKKGAEKKTIAVGAPLAGLALAALTAASEDETVEAAAEV